jgi:alpha-tubulin suppressor-like RCC1 family protein
LPPHWPVAFHITSEETSMIHFRPGPGPEGGCELELHLRMIMARIANGFRTFGPLGLACLALIATPPPAVRAQIVGPGVYAWGDNQYGELGNGTTTNSSTPVPVTGLSGVTVKAVAGGGLHSLAVTSTGAVYAWGFNGQGQLGNGTITSGGAANPTPAQVTGLSGVNITAVAGGGGQSLAVTSTGSVYACGNNNYGQLGNGTTVNSPTPIHVTGGGLSGVTVTAAAGGGAHSLALTSTGAVYAWGYNGNGELGTGNTTNSSTPVAVTGLSGVDVKAVSAGADHSLALTSTGAVYAWGYNNAGQLGNGTTTNALTALLVPFPADGSATVVSISAGRFDSFALESDGSLWAWGYNYQGQYGNGTITNSLTPIEVYTPAGGYGINAFAEGGDQSLAIVTPIPEPSSLLLVGAAIATAVGICRRRRPLAAASAGGIPHHQ